MKRMLLSILFFAQAAAANGTSVVGSKHDLSATGPGAIRAESERQVCVFCHIPHSGGDKLSSRPDVRAPQARPYGSSTARATASAPGGTTRDCLSCHDGTVAVGRIRIRDIPMAGAASAGKIPQTRRSNLGTDLRRSHPVSVQLVRSAAVRAPVATGRAKLDAAGQVQCTSCHDPHAEFAGATEGQFLRETARGSALCDECHPLDASGSHASSGAAFGPAQGNETPFSTVADAGCGACHRSHGADSRGRLLARSDTDDDDALCLRCHSGSVARLDVSRDLSKPYSHRFDAGNVHDAAEGPLNPRFRLPETSAAAPRHAACVDCHDPHQAVAGPRTAPAAGGPLSGSWGIDRSGAAVRPAANQFEICFKCHGDSANQPRLDVSLGGTLPRRAAADSNLRRVFAPDAPSNHSVADRHAGADVPSMALPWTTGSMIFCTDCHASDAGPGAGGSGPRGPHGSVYPRLLERNYATADGSIESATTYALCYKCHDRTKLLSPQSAFRLHRQHVVDARAPCSACHSAHGVSSRFGTPQHNAHLVDFDLTIVKPAGAASPYTVNGPRSGSCSLSCHGVIHNPRTY